MRRFSGHRQILQVKDSETDRETGRVVILLELAECDLHKFLEDENFALDAFTMIKLSNCLADCVQACHSRGVIHFDLKLQNFLVVRAGDEEVNDARAGTTGEKGSNEEFSPPHVFLGKYRLKLADFGLAHRLQESKTHLSGFGMHGTMLYMAPETIYQPTEDGRKKMGGQVDVWALGIILYQLLHAGATPWDQHRRLGRVGVGVTIANPQHVLKFDRAAAWAQQTKLFHQAVLGGAPHDSWFSSTSTVASLTTAAAKQGALANIQQEDVDGAQPLRGPSAGVSLALQTGVCGLRQALGRETGQSVKAVAACRGCVAHLHLMLEVLFRICEGCLKFDTTQRLKADELAQLCADAAGFCGAKFVAGVFAVGREGYFKESGVFLRDSCEAHALTRAVLPFGGAIIEGLLCRRGEDEDESRVALISGLSVVEKSGTTTDDDPGAGIAAADTTRRSTSVWWPWRVLMWIAIVTGLGMVVVAVSSAVNRNSATSGGGGLSAGTITSVVTDSESESLPSSSTGWVDVESMVAGQSLIVATDAPPTEEAPPSSSTEFAGPPNDRAFLSTWSNSGENGGVSSRPTPIPNPNPSVAPIFPLAPPAKSGAPTLSVPNLSALAPPGVTEASDALSFLDHPTPPQHQIGVAEAWSDDPISSPPVTSTQVGRLVPKMVSPDATTATAAAHVHHR